MAEDASTLESSAEALVTMKEGKGNSFQATSPRRGHPVRIRKPNPRIFGDEEDLFRASPRPKKQAKVTTVSNLAPTQVSKKQKVIQKHGEPGSFQKRLLSTPDKQAAQAIGVRLRNLLKLPKAHKWVCYEWFYSNIDMPLFEGENDFCICLRESFPQLKTRKLKRVEWVKIRRLMGKPRRCSAAFFDEERAVLQARRQKIRMLQQRKASEVPDLKDLPEEIPMPLVIGTKVTARLRKPQDGLFTGVIDALDTVNNTYRVTFDRPGLGTHSISDCEVLSNEPQETMPLSAFQARHRPSRQNLFTPPRFVPGISSPQLVSEENDPLLGSSPLRGKALALEGGGTYGGFPVKFLVLVTRLTKILGIKKDRVKELKDMNAEAEKLKSYGKSLPVHFQQKYAATVLELERLNKDLNEYLVQVQQFSHELAPEQGVSMLEPPSEIKRKCEDDAEDLVKRTNTHQSHHNKQGRKMVKNERMLDLVVKLTSLLLQVKCFAENDLHSFEFRSLQDSLNEIKDSIDPSNIPTFQNSVEIHINHIQSGLTQMGNLHAFSAVPPVPL